MGRVEGIMADRGSAAAGEMSNSKRQEAARRTSPAMAMSDKRSRAKRLCLGLTIVDPRGSGPRIRIAITRRVEFFEPSSTRI